MMATMRLGSFGAATSSWASKRPLGPTSVAPNPPAVPNDHSNHNNPWRWVRAGPMTMQPPRDSKDRQQDQHWSFCF
ncbi:hypothetical protein CDEST_14653 [Colletotrichum destructivum]|uniref:Secreted protein n=1 Tax=Colletotrichum destructivum TaxID=34406 RepID=A0AAX4J248_9PEZI|nr:hypothetical protein CDEST_14653 [Colletotrichum destructivum]